MAEFVRDLAFISCHKQDRPWLDRLEVHLGPLLRRSELSYWSSSQMLAGDSLQAQVNHALSRACVLVLMVSADYLASPEIEHMLKVTKDTAVPLLWVPVSPSAYEETALADITPLLEPARALALLPREVAEGELVQICRRIAAAMNFSHTDKDKTGAALAGNPAQLIDFSLFERKSLVAEVWTLLLKERRLLLLAPERGGARTLARQVVTASGMPDGAITRLAPATSAATTKSYFASLTGDLRINSASEFASWQRHRAKRQRRHLIVLMHDGGPEKGLRELAATLRGLLHESDSPFLVLVAGAARAARLRFEVDDLSLFSGVRVCRVPDLKPLEVATITALPPDCALALQQATGGHPGFLRDVVSSGALPKHAETLTSEAAARLLQSGVLSGLIGYRLRQDDRDKQKHRHAALVLESLLQGQRVRKLDEPGVSDFFKWGEVRLYYDGLVRTHEITGDTVLRCDAVRQVSELIIRHWREGQE